MAARQSPGNTPRMWRRSFHNALGHGMHNVKIVVVGIRCAAPDRIDEPLNRRIADELIRQQYVHVGLQQYVHIMRVAAVKPRQPPAAICSLVSGMHL